MRALILIAAAAALVTGSVALASGRAFLVREWFSGGNQMCQYDNGAVLNVGSRSCPTSINS